MLDLSAISSVFKITARVDGEYPVIRLRNNIQGLSKDTQSLARNFSFVSNAARSFITFSAFKGVVNAGDAMNDLSIKTKISVEELSKLKVVAEQNDASVQDLATAWKFMRNNQSEAINGNKSAVQSFKQIGISIDDLKKMSTQDLFLEVAQRVSELGRESDKTKVLLDVFGKSGDSMGVLFENGADGIKKAMDQVDRLGLTMSKETAERMDEFNDRWIVFVTYAERLAQLSFVGVSKFIEGMAGKTAALMDPMTANSPDEISLALESQQKYRARLMKNYVQNVFDPGEIEKYKARIKEVDSDIAMLQRKQQMLNDPPPATDQKKPGRKLIGGAFDARAERDREREIEQMEKYIEKERQQNITLAQQADLIGLTTVEIEKLKAARQLDAEVAEKTLNMSPQIKQQFKEQAEAIKQQRLEIIQLNYDQSRTFGAGTKQAVSEYVESIGDAASRARDMWKNAFKGMEDALVDFVSTGKLSFTGLAQSIIKDMIRIQIQQSVTGPLASWIGSLNPFGASAGVNYGTEFGPPMPAGFALGGIMSSSGPLPLRKYRNGGIANSPQLAIFGEGEHNEAYVPLPDGRSIPVTMKSGSGNSVVNNVNINVSTGGETQASGSDAGLTQFGRLMAATAKSVIINEMRPGGLLAQHRMA